MLHPSQCIYSCICPPLVAPTPSELNSPRSPAGKMRGRVKCMCGWVCEGSVRFLHRHSHIYVTVGLLATTIDLSHLFQWRHPCGKDSHSVFPVMHRGARHWRTNRRNVLQASCGGYLWECEPFIFGVATTTICGWQHLELWIELNHECTSPVFETCLWSYNFSWVLEVPWS